MCAYSMIVDAHRHHPVEWWDQSKWNYYQDFLKKAKEYDDKTGQKDCEEAEKQDFHKKILERLDAIEKKLEGK